MPTTIDRITTHACHNDGLLQLLVAVTDSDGATGIGEAWWGIANRELASPTAPLLPIQSAIDHVLAPRYVGRASNAIESLWFDAWDYAYRYGDGGIITMALSGIDLALWDLRGKTLGVPVNDLLGGPAHESVKAYASLPPLRDYDLLAAECRRAVDAGYRAIKLHELTGEHARVARDAVGSDIALMMDVNGHFNLADAERLAHELKDAGYLWFEEPIRPMRDHRALTDIAQLSPVPIAAGENEYSLASFERLLQTRSIRYLQPEITKIGGLTAARRVSALAELHNVALCPHNFRLGPSLFASIHWGFASPATQWLEFPWVPPGLAFPGGAQLPTVTDGVVNLPDGAGFGPTSSLDLT